MAQVKSCFEKKGTGMAATYKSTGAAFVWRRPLTYEERKAKAAVVEKEILGRVTESNTITCSRALTRTGYRYAIREIRGMNDIPFYAEVTDPLDEKSRELDPLVPATNFALALLAGASAVPTELMQSYVDGEDAILMKSTEGYTSDMRMKFQKEGAPEIKRRLSAILDRAERKGDGDRSEFTFSMSWVDVDAPRKKPDSSGGLRSLIWIPALIASLVAGSLLNDADNSEPVRQVSVDYTLVASVDQNDPGDDVAFCSESSHDPSFAPESPLPVESIYLAESSHDPAVNNPYT